MKTMKRTTNTIICVIMALTLFNITACKKVSSFDYPPSVGTAYDILKNDNTYSTFFAAIVRSGLGDLFQGNDAYTIYAPTNTAITNEGYTTAQLNTMLLPDLTVFVKSHIVSGSTDVTSINGSLQQTTLAGTSITVKKIGSRVYVNGGDITNPSIPVKNGFLNIATTVLTVKTDLLTALNAYNSGTVNLTYTFLAAAIARASTGSTNFTALLTGTTPYTLFAPNNNAFIDGGYASITAINAANPDVLGAILKYHMIAGAKLTTDFDSTAVGSFAGTPIYFDEAPRNVSASTTVATNVTYWYANGIYFGNSVPSNIVTGNGVMHGVARLLPTPVTTTTLARINADATLTEFAALITRASTADPAYNFASWLNDNTKSFTVFAVNNAGLQAAGYADVNAINAASPAVLASVLKLHMVARRINNINIAENGAIPSLLSGSSLTVNTSGGYKIKGATNTASVPVIAGNVVTTNGILNTIGTLLTP
jgi:uncharacterized surface protein with fasciclin (FAS1) repeats